MSCSPLKRGTKIATAIAPSLAPSSLKPEGESNAYVALLDTHKNAVAQVLLKTDDDGFIKPLIDQDPRIGKALAIRIGIAHKNQPIQLISLSSFKP